MSRPEDEISLTAGVPTAAEHRSLMQSVGFTVFPEEIARRSLAASVFGVTLRAGETCIGMGRIVGDGVCFVEIIDIVVAPAHQGRGHGKAIVAALMDFVETTLPEGAFVSLSAHVPADRLYAHFGFEETAPEAVGMCYRVGARLRG